MKGKGRPGGQPTLADVAREASVSKAAAARVLGGYGYAGPEMRERVFGAAERLAYQPNQLARSMATGRSKTIGVVVADIENLYFARAIRGIADTARASGFGVVLANTDENIGLERDAVRVLLANRVDGLIVSPASSTEIDHLTAAREVGCPLVLFDRRVPKLGADTFAIDNFQAAHEAVTALIARGHSRIALVSNAVPNADKGRLISSVRERIDGYGSALSDAGMEVAPELTILAARNIEGLSHRLRGLCQSADRPTAFLATDNTVALALLRILRDLDLSIPDEVSLVSFDDADWTAALTPALTVVSQPIRELATMATEDLIARLHGEGEVPVKETLLRATLMVRGSVGHVPSKPPVERRLREVGT